jgi:hypothetical protein
VFEKGKKKLQLTYRPKRIQMISLEMEKGEERGIVQEKRMKKGKRARASPTNSLLPRISPNKTQCSRNQRFGLLNPIIPILE